MIGILIAATYAAQALGVIGLIVGFWLLIDRGTRSPASRTAARVMHPSNGEARRLPQRRATPERVAELRRQGHV